MECFDKRLSETDLNKSFTRMFKLYNLSICMYIYFTNSYCKLKIELFRNI